MTQLSARLDLSGLRCPLPLLKTKLELKTLPKGGRLEVITTDPASVKDISTFCEKSGHLLLSLKEIDQKFYFDIHKPS